MIKPGYSSLVLLMLLCAALCCTGLGCSSSHTPPAPFQFVLPTNSPAIDLGQTVSLTVSAPANWSLQTAFGKPVGSLTSAPGTSATYTAPTALAGSAAAQVTIVATAVSDPTQSASVAVIIEPPLKITSASPTPVTTGCPAAGTVIVGSGPTFGTVWTLGSSSLVYDLTGSGGVTPYTWSISSGTLPAGLSLAPDLTTNLTAISGTPTSQGCASVTLQITDAAGVSVTAPYYVLVIPPALGVQVPPAANPYVGIPYPPTALKATGGVPPYTWTPDSSFGAAFPPGLGMSSPAQNPNIAVISGTPSSAGLLLSYSPAVYVYDSQLPYPAVAHPGVSMGSGQVLSPDSTCHAGAEGNLTAQGSYAFLLRGWDANGLVIMAGNFVVDGAGHVTGGAEDITRTSGVQTNLGVLAGSSYTVGQDNRGCVTLVNSAGTTMTLRAAFGSCSTSANTGASGGCLNSGYFTGGRVIAFGDSASSGTRVAGVIRLQDSSAFSAGLSGLCAFGLGGMDAAGGRYAIAGSSNASSGNFSAVAADINDAGTLSSNLTGGSGTFSIGSNGRGTATLSVGPANLGLAVYLVNSSEALLATTDAVDSTHPILSGEVLSAPGPLTVAALQNTYLLRTAGLSSGTPDANVGLVTFDGLALASGTVYENNGGTLGTTALSSNYAVDGNSGRLTFTILQTNQNLGAHPPVGYMVSATSGVSAFLVSTDASAQAGVLEYQIQNPPPTTFSSASLVGPSYFGTDENLDANATYRVCATSPNGVGGAGYVCDVSSPGSSGLVPNEAFAASYSIGKNGVGVFGGQTVSATNGNTVFFMDESPLNLDPAVTVLEQ